MGDAPSEVFDAGTRRPEQAAVGAPYLSPRFRVSAPLRAEPLRVAACELVPVLSLVAAALVLFRDALFAGQLFYEQDTLLYYYPLTQWFAGQLASGHLPLWLPNIFGGYPVLADGEIGPFYPFKLAALLLLEPGQALLWLRVLHFCLAPALMYALMRVLGASRLGSIVAGLVFGFGGFLAAQMHHENVVRTAVWLPLVLLLAELALRRRGWAHQRLLVAAGLVLGIALLGLHVQPALMMVMALGLYVAARLAVAGHTNLTPALSLWERVRVRAVAPVFRGGWALGLILGLAAALSAVQWIPLYEQGRTSFRGQGVGYEFASAFAVAPANLPTLLFPYFFRLPEGTWWMLWTPWETLFYAGVAPLVLALLGLLRAPRRLGLYFTLLAGLSLLIAMSHYGPLNLHEALWRLPGLSFLRAPGRFSYLFTFAIAGLAAFGTDWLAAPERRRRSLLLVASALSGFLGLVLLLLQSWHRWLLEDTTRAHAYLESTYLALRRQSEQPTVEMVYRGLLWSTELENPKTLLSLGFLAGLAALALMRTWTVGRGPWTGAQRPGFTIGSLWAAALIALVALDVLAFAYDFHPRAPLETLRQPGQLLEALAERPAARMLAGPGVPALEANRPLVAGLYDLSGYSSLPSQRHFDYWSRARATPGVLLDLWGARAYIAADDGQTAVRRGGYAYYPSQPLLNGPRGNPAGRETFSLPGPVASEVHLIGSLSHAVEVEQDTVVGEVLLEDDQGAIQRLALRAGQHVAERAYDRADVRPAVRHDRPEVLQTVAEMNVGGSLFPVHFYLARLHLEQSTRITRLSVRALLDHGELTVFGISLADAEGAVTYSVRPTERDKFHPLERFDSVTIYRNSQAFPRAFVVPRAVGLDPARREPPLVQMRTAAFDPSREVLLERTLAPLPPIGQPPGEAERSGELVPARVEDYSPEHVRVQVDLAKSGYLVLIDMYHRGWQARLDGQPTRLYLANSLFRAVEVPAGRHVVDFVFDPLSVRLGAFLSLEALVFAALVLGGSYLISLTRRKRRHDGYG